MYANNRLGTPGKAIFRTAGGSVYTFAHPFLTGQISVGSAPAHPIISGLNEVDVSSSLKLNDTFFNATPNQDNALQEVMVDGSTITITNHLMNGKATLQVVPGSGLVRDGDLTAIAPFIASAKDNVGGVLTRKRFGSSGVLTRVYYGVSFANFPHDVDAGNAVPIYTITMLYSGWIEGLRSGGAGIDRLLWAVGNQYGLSGNFRPFAINGIGSVALADDGGSMNTDIDSNSADAAIYAAGNIAKFDGANGIVGGLEQQQHPDAWTTPAGGTGNP